MPLPELLSDVLLSLPVKSLLRFRCLSSSVCAEIDSDDFVQNHLKRSIGAKTGLKLIISQLRPTASTDLYAADFDDGLTEATTLHNPFKSPHRGTVVCGSVNGLILLCISVKQVTEWSCSIAELALWNPFTRRYKLIPPCPEPSCRCTDCSCGLGYYSALDDYKVVMISHPHYPHPYDHDDDAYYDDDIQTIVETWVFSLKSNSWRKIQDTRVDIGTPISDLPYPQEGSFANGALYWIRDEDEEMILGFNLASEVFFNIPSKVARLYSMDIAVADGNLYIANLSGRIQEFYLGVSNNGGDEAGGSLRVAFEVDEGVDRLIYPSWPLTFSKNWDSVLLCREHKIFWYNLEKKSRQRVDIVGMPEVKDVWYHVCWESLVSLGNDIAL